MDPPADWVHGFTVVDKAACAAPTDPATLYAFYRAQADPDAFTDAERNGTEFASIDLETAGPSGGEGFQPENGAIIEVGIVCYDRNGSETGRLSTLVDPGEAILATIGTGAEHIHHISPDDVRGQPSWAAVAPRVGAHLGQRTLIIQNARFERPWLGHHMPLAGVPFDPDRVTLDTKRIANQHFSHLPDFCLPTICANVDVAYTGGHRATHDAEVTARAFFEMKRIIHTRYAADPRFTGLPHPTSSA